MKTAVLVPCFNEEQTVGAVVRDFLSADPTVEVWVFDNNSTDDTARVAREAGAHVVPEYRQGKGNVVRSMFRVVDADVYVMVDGDDTYPAKDALALRAAVIEGRADMVIGDRLSSTYFDENQRRFHGVGNRLVRFLVNSLFDSKVRDIMTGCRCMSRAFVKTMPVTSTGFEIETELTIHALDKRFLLLETPIEYRDRPNGSDSKLDTFSDGARVLSMLAKLYRDYRPMRFFGLVAAVLVVAALVAFAVPLAEYIKTGLVTHFPTLIVSIGLGVAAMLSFTSGVMLDSIRLASRQEFELELSRFIREDARRA